MNEEIDNWLEKHGLQNIKEAQTGVRDVTYQVFDEETYWRAELQLGDMRCRVYPYDEPDDEDDDVLSSLYPWSKVMAWVADHGQVTQEREVDFFDAMEAP